MRRIKPSHFFAFIILCFTLFFFSYAFKFLLRSDFKAHIFLYQDALEENQILIPPLYYWAIHALDYIIYYKYEFVLSAIFIMSISKVFTYYITKHYLSADQNSWPIAFIAFGLFLFMPIVNPFSEGEFWYLGKFTSNIWHNSTTIFVFPFSLLLYIFSMRWVRNPTKKHYLLTLSFGLLTLLAKPSFLFAFIPAFPLFVLMIEKKISKITLQSILLSSFLLGLIVIQKLILYDLESLRHQFYSLAGKSEIGIAPFEVFLYYSENIGWDILSSFLFLGVTGILFRKNIRLDNEWIYILFLLFFGLSVYFLFVEKGSRIYDGNFYWQVPIVLYISHLFVTKKVIEAWYFNNQLNKWRFAIFLCLFLCHTISGIAYLIRYIVIDRFH